MTRYFVRHPVTTWMIFGVFVVLGAYAVPRIQVEAVPDVDSPKLSVNTIWSGASPTAVQRSISVPVEEAARGIRGVESIESTSSFGQSVVTVELRRDVDVDFAQMELNEALGSVRRSLPPGASQPVVVQYVPEEFKVKDFFTVSVEGDTTDDALREIAEDRIVPRLLSVEGVANASVLGGARRVVRVVLDRPLLERYGIRADEVFTALRRLDAFTGAGVVRRSGLEAIVAIRERVDVDRIRRAVVAHRGGRSFTVDMLGDVRTGFEDPVYIVRANGRSVVQVSVDKRSGANSIAVSRRVRAALPDIAARISIPIRFHVDADVGRDLEKKLVDLVQRSGIILALLFLVLVVTLRQVRLTVIVTASIGFAIVISLALFYFLGISVNFVTISGLAVCFGLILDNSILVLDSIHRRMAVLERADARDLSRRARLRVASAAIVAGANDVVFPILATTLTTIVAFASFVFLSGRLALYYVPLGITVATAMAASLFVAFGWVPTVLDGWWARRVVARQPDGPRDDVSPDFVDAIIAERPATEERPSRFQRIVMGQQRAWWILVPACAGLLVWGADVYRNKVIKGGFWRFPEKEELLVFVRMPEGTDIEVTSATMERFERVVGDLPPGARMVSRIFGNIGVVRIEFSDSLEATPLPMYCRALWVEVGDQTGGSSVFIRGFSDQPYVKGTFGGSNFNSLIRLSGYNSKRLMEMAQETLARVRRSRRARHAHISTGQAFSRGQREEMVIDIRRDRLAQYGLTVADIVPQVRRLLGVDIPWTMLVDGKLERVQLEYTDAERVAWTDVADHVFTTPSGQRVRLGELVTVSREEVPQSIQRRNQKYTMYVNWEYLGTEAMRQRFMKRMLAGIRLPYGYEAEEAQRIFFSEEEEGELKLAVWLSVAFIFFVMAALFESLGLPLLVLVTLPMALVGVFVLFWLTHSSFDSSARIGLILLFGIVVNNAILLVSRFRTESWLELRARLGFDPAETLSLVPGLRRRPGGGELRMIEGDRAVVLRRAVARATAVRLRSILLTTATTVVGLAPLLVHVNETESKDVWENLALASIGGLVASTVLLLATFPALYYLCVRVRWLAAGARDRVVARLRRHEAQAQSTS